jgi:hypothetical protein
LAAYSYGRGGEHDSWIISDVANTTRVLPRGFPALFATAFLSRERPREKILRRGEPASEVGRTHGWYSRETLPAVVDHHEGYPMATQLFQGCRMLVRQYEDDP